MIRLLLFFAALVCTLPAFGKTADGRRKLVLIAGKPSHPPREHEFRAGALLLQKCLTGIPGLAVEVHGMGWVKDEKTFEDADAVVFYAGGRTGHPAVQGDHLAKLQALIDKGVGFGCMHYAVEVIPDVAGEQFKRWLGGHYENQFSVNPMWEPAFDHFPVHPITRGVPPFQIKDEWYFNMRFADDFSADGPKESEGMKFVPILVAKPADAVRNGPYVSPPGPYRHIQAAAGRPEAMMWAVERPDGGRSFGFTGGHFHDNWANGGFRKIVLNALLWVSKVEVPVQGVQSQVTKEDIEANLDRKPAPPATAPPK